MQHRRKGALVSAALLLTLAACGSGSDGAAPPAADEQPAAADVPTGDDFSESDTTEAVANPTDPPSSEAPEAIEAEQPDVTEAAPEGEDAPAAPVAAAPAEPVVGGRLFAADVQPAAQFDSNPFPDLVVDDIGKDVQVNISNILPSDRPVLLWAWAPH